MKYIHPRRIWNKAKSNGLHVFLRKVWYRYLSTCRHVEGTWVFAQAGLMNGSGRIIGHDAHIGFYPSCSYYDGLFYIEARHKDAIVELGNSFYNNGFTAIAEHGKISIGNDCLIGTNVQIINSDFHPVSLARRHVGGVKVKMFA